MCKCEFCVSVEFQACVVMAHWGHIGKRLAV